MTVSPDPEETAPLPRRIIRTLDDVITATSYIERTVLPWRGEEGPRWRMTFSPGAFQIGTRDYAKVNATHERAVAARLRDNSGMTLTDEPVKQQHGKITDWSSKSRTRMIRRLCTLDYTPLFAGGLRPALVTLTLPHDWETVAGTADQFKACIERFKSSYLKIWGVAIRGIWKMEFQFRVACAAQGCHDPRAPHLHILTTIPEGLTKSGQTFAEWLPRAWAQSVRHPDPEQRRLHESAGTAIDWEDTLSYADAKRIAVYFTKHGVLADKEYQNHMPDAWQAAEAGGARFWGYWGLRPAESTVETDAEMAAFIARQIRAMHDAEKRSRQQGVWRSKPLGKNEDPEVAIMSACTTAGRFHSPKPECTRRIASKSTAATS